MKYNNMINRIKLAILLSMAFNFSFAQDYEPKRGQSGKDVIWIPTSQSLVDKMLDMAEVTPDDFVMDLGSGDGRLVITAAKRGATALGIEYNPDMVELSKKNALKEGVSDKAKFKKADLFEVDLSKATVITMFLLPEINNKLRPRLLELTPGTRIVSNSFDMDEWEADEIANVNYDCESYCNALLWIVPAKVEGEWKFDQGRLIIDQQFQKFSGTYINGNKSYDISEGHINGYEISFTANGSTYKGTVNGKNIQGTYKQNGETKNWLASRK